MAKQPTLGAGARFGAKKAVPKDTKAVGAKPFGAKRKKGK